MTLTQIKPLGLSKPVDLADNEKIRLGTGNDLEIYHSGSHNIIGNTATQLRIITDELRFRSATGSETYGQANVNGGFELHHNNIKKFETTSFGVQFAEDVQFPSPGDDNALTWDKSEFTLEHRTNVKTSWGDNKDLQIYHDGNSRIDHDGSGVLVIRTLGTSEDIQLLSARDILLRPQGGESGITINGNGAVELYYDNSKKLHTQANGVTVTGYIQMDGTEASAAAGNIYIEDNGKAVFGNGSDLQIYHDGSNSYIKDAGTGGIYLDTTFLHVRQGSGESMINAVADAQVELFHNNSKKFRTQADGVEILSTGSWHGLEVKHSNGNVVAKLQNKGSGDEGYFALYDSGGTGPSIQMDGEHGRITATSIRLGTNSADNEMDDYEEGSWTPTFDTSISGGSITVAGYVTQSGFYRKVGSLVYVEGALKTTSVTKNSNGTWDIAGLPFTAASGGGAQTSGQIFGGAQQSWSVAPDKFTVIASNTRARAREGLDDGASTYSNGNTTMFNTSDSNVNRVYFSGTYIAA